MSSKRSRKTTRQIKRNITGWLDNGKGRYASGTAANAVFGICAALITALLPLSLMALAAGLVFRVPDILAFELDRRDAPAELGIDKTAGDIASELADYLTHKKDGLTLTKEVGRKELPVFSESDEAFLKAMRDVLDKTLYPSVCAFALSLLLFFVCLFAGKRRYLRRAMNGSVVFFIGAVMFIIAVALSALRGDMAVLPWWPDTGISDADMLPRLLNFFYPIESAGAICLISFIIFVALYSFSRRLTVEKESMFKYHPDN